MALRSRPGPQHCIRRRVVGVARVLHPRDGGESLVRGLRAPLVVSDVLELEERVVDQRRRLLVRLALHRLGGGSVVRLDLLADARDVLVVCARTGVGERRNFAPVLPSPVFLGSVLMTKIWGQAGHFIENE